MSKYIVDINDFEPMFKVDSIGVFGIGKSVTDNTEEHSWSRIKSIDGFEELNSDYINEHYGELQDEAYKRGYEDGKWKAEDGCDGCKYYEDTSLTNPCSECSRGHVDRYEPLSDPDRIEVGDEVIWKTKNVTLIVTSTYVAAGFEWCDGVAQDGKVYHTLADNNKKTGKHYDIASILEAMRQ